MTIGFDQFAWVARLHGLSMEPKESALLSSYVALDGEVDGVRVHVRQWVGQFVHVELSAFVDPPADMRLSIRTAGLGTKLGHLLGKHDVDVGDPAFDEAFEVKGDEPERVKALLTPELRAGLLAWKRANASFYVTDEGAFLFTLPGAYSTLSAETLEANLLATVSLARALREALRHVPPSTVLAAHVEAWSEYAASHGLGFAASPLRAWGTLDGSAFVARAVAVANHDYGVDLRLRFPVRLPWSISVRPARFFDFLERTGDAVRIVTGDPDFDHELHVVTTDPAGAKAFLDDDVRAALLGLHRDEGDLSLDADGMSVRTKTMTDPAGFGRIVDRVARVAHDLAASSG